MRGIKYVRSLKTDELFVKFLLSYLLVLFIPILFINGLFSYRFIYAYQKEIQSQVDIDLVHVGNLIDTEMQTLSRIVDQLRLSIDFNKYQFEDDPLVGRIYMDNLSIYSTTNPFISEMALYLRDEEYMFLDKSTCQVDFFLDQLYQFENTSSL